MRVIKKQSKQTYTNTKTGKEAHYYNYWLECPNGVRIQIKCAFNDDVKRLDMVAEYER